MMVRLLRSRYFAVAEKRRQDVIVTEEPLVGLVLWPSRRGTPETEL